MNLYPSLGNYIVAAVARFDTISVERKAILKDLAEYIKSTNSPKINFICTHNSRRSHLSQIWAQTAAAYYGVQLETFSGGTEATAFNPNAVNAVAAAGFRVESEDVANPEYKVFLGDDHPPMVCFSKRFDDEVNPSSGFAAAMTCSEADSDCPVVFGADKRIKLFYEDPKVSDGTPEQEETYSKRCEQIATEMLYVLQHAT